MKDERKREQRKSLKRKNKVKRKEKRKIKKSSKEREAREFKEIAKIFKKMKKESSNKGLRKAKMIPKKRLDGVLTFGIKPDYCEFKKRMSKKQSIIGVTFDDNEEDNVGKNSDSSNKIDDEIEMEIPNLGIFVEKKTSEKDDIVGKDQGSIDTLNIQKVIKEEIERAKE